MGKLRPEGRRTLSMGDQIESQSREWVTINSHPKSNISGQVFFEFQKHVNTCVLNTLEFAHLIYQPHNNHVHWPVSHAPFFKSFHEIGTCNESFPCHPSHCQDGLQGRQ
jgi:hypothetical protein